MGAILIDEYLRYDWVDERRDWLAKLGQDTSVGIAQVLISTARYLVKEGFCPADPFNKYISPEYIDKVTGGPLYKYLNNPEHSIHFVAAKINQIKKEFASEYDIKNLGVVASLYSQGSLKKTKGKPTPRGEQIATEFYKLAKTALKK